MPGDSRTGLLCFLWSGTRQANVSSGSAGVPSPFPTMEGTGGQRQGLQDMGHEEFMWVVRPAQLSPLIRASASVANHQLLVWGSLVPGSVPTISLSHRPYTENREAGRLTQSHTAGRLQSCNSNPDPGIECTPSQVGREANLAGEMAGWLRALAALLASSRRSRFDSQHPP